MANFRKKSGKSSTKKTKSSFFLSSSPHVCLPKLLYICYHKQLMNDLGIHLLLILTPLKRLQRHIQERTINTYPRNTLRIKYLWLQMCSKRATHKISSIPMRWQSGYTPRILNPTLCPLLPANRISDSYGRTHSEHWWVML